MAKKSSKKPAAIRPAAKSASKTPAARKSRSPKPSPRAVAPRVGSKPQNSLASKAAKKRPITAAEPPLPPPAILIPRPVTTDGKPRKNQIGLTSRELEHYRELLLAKRRELVGDMSSMEREALRSTTGTNLSNLPLHMADMGTDNYEQEFTLGLVEKDRQLLREINRALAKLINGMYGICEGTGKPIGKARLEAQPWAKYSIEYARQMERGMIRR